jgi:hypothetical protein
MTLHATPAAAGTIPAAPALRLCLDTDSGLPAALPQQKALPVTSGRQPQTPARAGSGTPAQTPPRAGRLPAAASPPTPSQDALHSPAALLSPAGVSKAAAGGAAAASAGLPAQAQAPHSSAANGSSGSSEAEWPLRVLAGGGPRQRRLLAALAARQLSGCRPLAGNAAVLPLLGRDIVFRVGSGFRA